MSDLVGNPEDRFSRVEAHFIELHEPWHEKTNNLGFQPGRTQTRLYSHRKQKLEILDFERRGITLSKERKQRC